MAQWVLNRYADLRNNIGVQSVGQARAVRGESNAHTWRVTVMDGMAAANLDGYSAQCSYIRPDGGTIYIDGSISGNVAEIVFPAACYAYVGTGSAILRLINNAAGVNIVIDGLMFTIGESETDVVIDPGNVVPSLSDLLAQMDAMEAATSEANDAAALANAKAALADTATTNANNAASAANAGEAARSVFEAWNSAKAYVVGNKVAKDGSSYVCIAPNTNQAPPNATYWLLIAAKGDNTTAAAVSTGDGSNVQAKLDAHASQLAEITNEKLVAMNNIVSFASGISPTITVSGDTITVKFNAAMYNTKRFDTGDYKMINPTGQTYTLVHNDILLWHLDTNTITVSQIFSTSKNNAIILLFNSNGTMPYGALLPFATAASLASATPWVAINPSLGGYKMPNIDSTAETITFYANTDLLIGNSVYTISVDTVVSLVVAGGTSTYKIYFNPSNSTFGVVAWNTGIPTGTYLVGYGRRGVKGRMTALFDYTIDGFEYWNGSNTRQTVSEPFGKHFIIDDFAADQGMAVVGERIFVFRAGADDHSTYANIEIYDKNTFLKIGTAKHNLGHAANASYCSDTDTLMVSNSNLSSAPPEIQLITNASSIEPSDVIEYDEIMAIRLYEGSAGALTKDLGRTAILWAFGDSPYIVYGHAMSRSNGTVDQTKSVYYKVLLGMGSNDFSDSTGTDLTKWGTFESGKTSDEYNGTAKIIAQYTGNYAGISQGACWHDGKFFFATTSETNAADVMVFRFGSGQATMVERYTAPFINKDGTVPNQEAEGCAILDGRYLICGYRGGGGEKLVKFPLYNEQGGVGTIGTPVTFEFPCNSVPRVQITPLSATTDLYISAVSRTGFTVSSVSNGSGTFSWECKIS